MTRSLRFKVTVGVMFFIVMVSVLLSTLFVVYMETSQREASKRLVEEATIVIAATIGHSLAEGSELALRDRLAGFLDDTRILYVVASNGAGEVFRITDHCPPDLLPVLERPPPSTAPFREHALPGGRPGERMEITAPLPGESGANAGGMVRVGYLVGARADRAAELRWRAIVITLAMIVLGTAGTMFLSGRVVGPIQDLARCATAIADGDLHVRVPEESDDEVGLLAVSFNRMTARLRASIEVERGLSRDLERRVRDKTREIGETREHLSNVVEHVGASIIVADLDGTILSANTYTMHIFGTKPEFTVGRHLDEFTCRSDLHVAGIREALESTGAPHVYNAHFHLDESHDIEVLITHTLLRDVHGDAGGYLQITKDITELRRMEKRLVSSERLSAMGEMAGEIGHELNNYLMAIGGRAELITAALARGADRRSLAKVEKGARIIAEQVADMRRLTDGLLNSARKETSPAEIDLGELVRSTVEFVRPQNRYDRITFDVKVENPPLVTLADPQQIRQVVLNLLANAADATIERNREGGEIRVRVFRDRTGVGMVVSDDGAGIDERTRARLFEPHFTTKPTGHGFGLAVCHRVVENHGGSIRVESAPGAGATFTVRLPPKARESRGAVASATP
ncbi:HAMP domain-containing protein [bacterium]|nr:HAMP domain-containing protein [bacterium]